MFRYIFFLALFIFTGCSFHEPIISSKAYHIVLKNTQFALNDTGFINSSSSSKELQIFTAGSVVLDLHVKKQMICKGLGCVSKEEFNEQFLGNKHYENILEDILEFQPIYEKQDLQKIENGFEQRISSSDFDIVYKVTGKNLYFKDRKNRVLIKLRELGEGK